MKLSFAKLKTVKRTVIARESQAPYIFPPDELDDFLGAFGIKAEKIIAGTDARKICTAFST